MHQLTDFDFDLPKELIAQSPSVPRDHSRLMIVDRSTQTITHDRFFNLKKYLRPDDLLIFNQTKVFPARLVGHKESGGKIEVLLLSQTDNHWQFIGKNIGRAKRLFFAQDLVAEVDNGILKFNCNYPELMTKLTDIGQVPLPPYIDAEETLTDPNLKQKYQTVYATDLGSAAAPTAGLHFTPELLESIPNKAYVTLHVGLGTFLPVKTENILDHKMHSEQFEIAPEVRSQILDTSRRRIAVGTTSVRVLESDWNKKQTDIFIYPGYTFKNVDAMITNFHLPKSSLLMLVSAFAGTELIKKAYAEAIKERYRFFSFGDAMLII